MCINQFAKAFCVPGTASEHTPVIIYLYHDSERRVPLFNGEVKDLLNEGALADFMVVEMMVDHNPKFDHLPVYNKGKIITVV